MNFGLFQRFLIVRACIVSLICGAAIAGSAVELQAEPLDKEACKKLQTEKKSLVASGIVKQMAKGALWAKKNMSSAQLELVKRYITVDEQLQFRCGKALKVHAAKKSKKKETSSNNKEKATDTKKPASTASASANGGTASKPKSNASVQR
jgi:LAS superfamily LD-carboxypeptidase LdcB